MRHIWLSLVGLLCLILASPEMADADSRAALALTENDRILGSPDALITIIEYASLTCPHCARFERDVLAGLKQKWIDTGRVKLVLRDFPRDEADLRAAMVARCAPPDRYYAYVDAFLAAQENWSTARDYRDALARLAKLGGMSKDQFETCLNDTALENRIVEGRLIAAKELDVNATPTFFVNGTRLSGAPTLQEFDELLSRLSPKS